MPTRREVLKMMAVSATGTLLLMHQDITHITNVKFALPNISLEALHSTSQLLNPGDRIQATPNTVEQKLLLKTYGFQFSELASEGSIFQFYPERNKSIETISSIIYEDSKVSTYKIALLRALVDIASGLHNEHVQYNSEKDVDYAYIPYGLVCFQWIKYYWPLLENDIPLTSSLKSLFAHSSHVQRIATLFLHFLNT